MPQESDSHGVGIPGLTPGDPDGCVVQVSLSDGGLPKTAVARAWVGRLGLVGDRQTSDTVHGGPLRAVCIFGMEAIERVRADGHPLVPGAAGENITTRGIEWSRLPPGTRVRVGADLLLELTWASMPCYKQRPNFRAGLISRISIVRHPDDSRMYARVLREGEVRPGDIVHLLPPDPTSDASHLALLTRHEKATSAGWLAVWRAASRAGFDVRLIDDGDLVAVASPELDAPAFNRWLTGARTVPQLAPRVMDLFAGAGVTGLLESDECPAGSTSGPDLAILAATPEAIEATAPATGPRQGARVAVRPTDATGCARLLASLGPPSAEDLGSWELFRGLSHETLEAILGALPVGDGHRLLVAEQDGRPMACALLITHRRVGSLVLAGPGAGGDPVHPEVDALAALVRRLARVARDEGCDLLVAEAAVGSPWQRALGAAGMRESRRARTWLVTPGARVGGTP